MPQATLPPSSSAPAASAPVIKLCSAAGRKPRELLLAAACVAQSHQAQDTGILGYRDLESWSCKVRFKYPRSLGGLETLSAPALTEALLPRAIRRRGGVTEASPALQRVMSLAGIEPGLFFGSLIVASGCLCI